jgi:hypothetical protein
VSTLIVSIFGSELYLVVPDFLNGRFVLLASSGVMGLAGTVRAAIVPYLSWFWVTERYAVVRCRGGCK